MFLLGVTVNLKIKLFLCFDIYSYWFPILSFVPSFYVVSWVSVVVDVRETQSHDFDRCIVILFSLLRQLVTIHCFYLRNLVEKITLQLFLTFKRVKGHLHSHNEKRNHTTWFTTIMTYCDSTINLRQQRFIREKNLLSQLGGNDESCKPILKLLFLCT